MRLPNFDEFTPLTNLRKQMEATPSAHLSLVKIDRLRELGVEHQTLDWPELAAPIAFQEPEVAEEKIAAPAEPIIVQQFIPEAEQIIEEIPAAEQITEEIEPPPLMEWEPPVIEAPEIRPERTKPKALAKRKLKVAKKSGPVFKRKESVENATPHTHRALLERALQLGMLLVLNAGLLYMVFLFIAGLSAQKPKPEPVIAAPVKIAPPPKPVVEAPKPKPAPPPKPVALKTAPVQAAPVAQSAPAPVAAPPPPVALPAAKAPETKEMTLPAPAAPAAAVPVESKPAPVLDIPMREKPQPPAPEVTQESKPTPRQRPEPSTTHAPVGPSSPVVTQSPGHWTAPLIQYVDPKGGESQGALDEIQPDTITKRPFDDERRKAGEDVGW